MNTRTEQDDEIVFQQILDRLDDYRTIASDQGIEINATSLHTTHGIFYCSFDFQHVEQRNLEDLLGLEDAHNIQSYEEFYMKIYENILNVRDVKEKFHLFTSKFFNREIEEFRVRNILYKRRNELLYLDVSFSTLLEDSFVVFVDDVTDYVNDKLLLEEFAVHNNILVKEVHHRVKNNLQILLSLISIQQRYRYDDKTITDYMNLSISSMAIIHNQLYGDDLNHVSLKRIIDDYGSNIENFYGDLDIDFVLITNDNPKLTIEQSNPLFLILNELVINSIKHAFDDNSSHKVIKITFTMDDGTLLIKYEDNGKGLQDIEEHESGLGHVLLESLIRQVDGEYSISTGNGYEMNMRIPLNSREEK